MFARLKYANHHLKFFTEYGDASMFEAMTYVCSRDYPVVLFGYRYSTDFRITTTRTHDLRDGDWTIQFSWRPSDAVFHFALWQGTPSGVVAMPQRECELPEFYDAVDELIGQMAGVDCSLGTNEAEQGGADQPTAAVDLKSE